MRPPWTPLPREVAGPKSVMHLAGAAGYEADHAHQVARLAMTLFDLLEDLHPLGSEQRRLMQCGALLHDIGWLHGQKAHHKAAARMILSAELPPLDNRQRLLVANVARYHRKALPKLSHDHYAALDDDDRNRVDLLGGIVRLADGLDRSHTAVIDALACRADGDTIDLHCRAVGPAGFERWAASRKADLIQAALGRTVALKMVERT